MAGPCRSRVGGRGTGSRRDDDDAGRDEAEEDEQDRDQALHVVRLLVCVCGSCVYASGEGGRSAGLRRRVGVLRGSRRGGTRVQSEAAVSNGSATNVPPTGCAVSSPAVRAAASCSASRRPVASRPSRIAPQISSAIDAATRMVTTPPTTNSPMLLMTGRLEAGRWRRVRGSTGPRGRRRCPAVRVPRTRARRRARTRSQRRGRGADAPSLPGNPRPRRGSPTGGVASPRLGRRGGPAAADGRLLGDLVGGAESDEAVDDAGSGIGLAEIEPEERGDEVELRDRDEPPIHASDDDERRCKDIKLLHSSPPCGWFVHEMYRYWAMAVKSLLTVCTMHPCLEISGSASWPDGQASVRSFFARGSAATGCSGRTGPPAGTGSTRSRTSSVCAR